MAFLDPDRDLVVLRIVYDGAAFAGKTSTLRALGKSLSRPLYTPEEIAGRTIFFDWLDYEAGLFEGRRIRCQIVSVPGQSSFIARRRRLIESADVVVFVADTTRRGFPESRARLEELLGWLHDAPGPPVGVICQANKRDTEDALDIADVRAALPGSLEHLGIVESVATGGEGVREAFILSVRLALDRVREILRTTGLKAGRPPVDRGEELLQELSLDAPPASPVDIAVANDGSPSEEDHPPALPGRNVQSGLLWPVVTGRLMLQEATADQAELQRLGGGRWMASSPAGWWIETGPPVYETLEEGRQALLEWAQQHGASDHVLSPRRCIALVEAESGRWRLWQAVKQFPVLEDLARTALAEEDAEETVTGLVHIARALYCAADQLTRVALPLVPALHSIAMMEGRPRYVGLVPPLDHPRVDADAAIRGDLGGFLGSLEEQRREELLQALSRTRMHDDATGAGARALLVEALRGS